MTGDAVNDAAALKQADIGVAMGSGSEVTKQAARMILTDDNFGTLVHAVEIGRRVYDKIVSYVRYQMTQLLALILLFLAATVFDINDGVALTPPMVLYLLFFATALGVAIIAVDPGDPDVMHRPPRDPSVPITNRGAVMMWIGYAVALFVAALIPLVAGPDEPSTEQPSVSLTMTFVVMGLGTVFNAIVNRRDPASGLDAADPEVRGHRSRPGHDAVPRHPAADPATGAAHHQPDSDPVADLPRPRRAAAADGRDQQGGPAAQRAHALGRGCAASSQSGTCRRDPSRRPGPWPAMIRSEHRRSGRCRRHDQPRAGGSLSPEPKRSMITPCRRP